MNMPRLLSAVALCAALPACSPTDRQDATLPDSAAAPDTQARRDSLPVLEGVLQFAPVDEGESNASFAALRTRLRAALERRDTAAVLAAVAPDIRNTFGDDNGIPAFRRLWRLGEEDSELWRVLDRVLQHGGAFRVADEDTLFMAPYVYAVWPTEHDAFEHVATLTADALVREAPDSASPVLGSLPHRIVRHRRERSDPSAGPEWTELVLADDRRGWIASDDVYSPVDYRAIFARRNGQWRMVTLIAGD